MRKLISSLFLCLLFCFGTLAHARGIDYQELGPRLNCLDGRFVSIEGTHFVQCGALTYFVRNGMPASDGFHLFSRISKDEWIGTVGALKFLVRNGATISLGYHELHPTSYGYHAELGSIVYRLDKNGKEAK